MHPECGSENVKSKLSTTVGKKWSSVQIPTLLAIQSHLEEIELKMSPYCVLIFNLAYRSGSMEPGPPRSGV
jgi:hypothetical protein